MLQGLIDAVDRFIGRGDDWFSYLSAQATQVIETVERYQPLYTTEVEQSRLQAAASHARAAQVLLSVGGSQQAWLQLEQAEMYLDSVFGVFP